MMTSWTCFNTQYNDLWQDRMDPQSCDWLSKLWYHLSRCFSSIAVDTLRPRQNGRHFTDDIFKCIFMNENVWFPIKISLKFVPKGLIKNILALVPIMAWRRQGNKPLSEPMMVRLSTHICIPRPQWVKPLVQFESYWTILNTNVMALRLSEIRCFMQYWSGTLTPEAKHLGVLTHIDWHCQARLISDPMNANPVMKDNNTIYIPTTP